MVLGRILLPKELRSYAELTKQAVILGQGNKFEIWNESAWDIQSDEWLESVDDYSILTPESLQLLSL